PHRLELCVQVNHLVTPPGRPELWPATRRSGQAAARGEVFTARSVCTSRMSRQRNQFDSNVTSSAADIPRRQLIRRSEEAAQVSATSPATAGKDSHFCRSERRARLSA